MSIATDAPAKVSSLAGKPATPAMLVDVPRLVTAYYTDMPDASVQAQRVAFGTSGHRGSAFEGTFNEWHVLAISQAICDYRKRQGIGGPLFLGIDTHALSVPACASALEVLAANSVEVMLADKDEYTPTPAVSHAILVYNRGREMKLADAGLAVRGLFTVPNSVKAITPLVGLILMEHETRHSQGEATGLHLFYNRPSSGAVYAPVNQRLLPLDETWRRELAERPWPTGNLPEVMGDGTVTLRALIREYLFVSLFRACAESLASENASRLAAMQRADKNIDELLEDLDGTS